jgi:competence protein ComEA
MKVMSTVIIALMLLTSLPALAGQVDINTANAEAISAELKGIGLSKAKAIVEYRKKHGPFRSADDLSLVKGIGERTVEINRADIKVSGQKK